jgi:hypothetical protein
MQEPNVMDVKLSAHKIAKREIAEEDFRELVDKEKLRLRTYKPWWEIVFPFKIRITRI